MYLPLPCSGKTSQTYSLIIICFSESHVKSSQVKTNVHFANFTSPPQCVAPQCGGRWKKRAPRRTGCDTCPVWRYAALRFGVVLETGMYFQVARNDLLLDYAAITIAPLPAAGATSPPFAQAAGRRGQALRACRRMLTKSTDCQTLKNPARQGNAGCK